MEMPNIVISADLRTAWCVVCRAKIKTGIELPVLVSDLEPLLDVTVKPWAATHAVCHLKRDGR